MLVADRGTRIGPRSNLDPLGPIQGQTRLAEVRGGVGRQGGGACGDRRHDQGVGGQNTRGLGDDVGPPLGREHQVAANVLAPLVILRAVEQRIIVEKILRLLETARVDHGAGQCDARM